MCDVRRFDRDKAYRYYVRSGNFQGQGQCAYALDNYDALCKLVHQIPDGSEYLRDLGEKFTSVGLSSEAVACFMKLNDAKAAIDACVILNQVWSERRSHPTS